MDMKGAGGTSGGTAQFFLGLGMMCAGFYLLFNNIVVNTSFGFGYSVYSWGGMYSITSGMILIPFLFGVGLIFYNSRSILGWVLACGSLIAMLFGVIASIHFNFRGMSAFDLIVILVLAFGGLGLFARSLRDAEEAPKP